MREKSSGKILVVGAGGERKDSNGKQSTGKQGNSGVPKD